MIFPILHADDLPGTVAFYRDLIGMSESFRRPSRGEPAYVILMLGSSLLGIRTYDAFPGFAEADDPEPGHARAFELEIHVDDVDSLVIRIRRAGEFVLWGPEDFPWGERIAVVEDPEGNEVRLVSRVSD